MDSDKDNYRNKLLVDNQMQKQKKKEVIIPPALSLCSALVHFEAISAEKMKT